MTDLRTAAQAVIDSYELGITTRQVYYGHLLERNIEALRQALAEPVEPVKQAKEVKPAVWWNGHFKVCKPAAKEWDARTGATLSFDCDIPLYTTPPSLDALIAEIDGLSPSHVNDEYGCKHSDTLIMYHACDIKAILDKYRGVK